MDEPQTPFLALDEVLLDRNIERMNSLLDRLRIGIRPHVKTAKSVDVINRIFSGETGPITVSTLAEAERFADAGYDDIIYAVGIAPDKLPRVHDLIERGVDISVLVDCPPQVDAVARITTRGARVPMLIEVDADGHRGGLKPGSAALLALGELVDEAGELRGVLTHAGESYFAPNLHALAEAAENERLSAVRAASRLREHGLPCPVVSIGSTPTVNALTSADGVTEVRAGNFVFYDLVMAGIGVCSHDDIAISVVATVIGHQPEKDWILVDAGWTALSGDRGTAGQTVDQGYGLVTAMDGTPYPGLIVTRVTQEHGILAMRSSSDRVPDIAPGERVRILPNHACATAAQHDEYVVTNLGRDGRDPRSSQRVEKSWGRVRGW